jgi:hypothetical protein
MMGLIITIYPSYTNTHIGVFPDIPPNFLSVVYVQLENFYSIVVKYSYVGNSCRLRCWSLGSKS